MKPWFGVILICIPFYAYGADNLSLENAIDFARVSCGGISANMQNMKKLAGINTAVSGVGSATGIGATVSGISKANVDTAVDKIESLIARYKAAKSNIDIGYLLSLHFDEDKLHAQLNAKVIDLSELSEDYSNKITQLEKIRDKGVQTSKTLGNVRTGLMATGTATNIASAVIAGTNNVDNDIKGKIKQCLSAVDALRNAKMQARISGADSEELVRADAIVQACGKYEYANLSKIDNRAKGAVVSSGIGAATGLSGTITSAVANTDKTRNGDDNREKNLNTASNVLAGVTSAASLTATVFNATQIKAIKDVSNIADECEEALK